MITVMSCQFHDNGERRVYTFTDSSTVVECPEFPGKTRFRFCDSRNRAIYDRSSCAAMKKGVEQFKRMRGIKS